MKWAAVNKEMTNTTKALQVVKREPRVWPRLWRFQAQDFAWLLFVAVLIETIPETNYNYTILVIIIAAFQIVEPRWTLFSSQRGQVAAIALKLVLSYLLVGWTHGIQSFYYSVFLIPVVSAATLFELPGVILVTAIACGGYFSFLLPVFISAATRAELPPDYISVMSLRAAFYAIVGFLVYQQARAKREEMQRTQAAVVDLAKANADLQEVQASLRRSERLAALGQLTAGLAHELRNPLGTIRASAEMLSKPSAKGKPELMDEMAGFIRSEVDRMNGLVSSFLDFARPLEIHPAEADLSDVLQQVVWEQAELARAAGVTVVVRSADPLRFRFDRDLLRLALSNLLQNGIQASAAGKDVEMRTHANSHEVTILIMDHGEGILPEHLENIFNPFFTTKPKGVGLGLALVAKIVDEHGGRVNVWSERMRGTKFEIHLPKN